MMFDKDRFLYNVIEYETSDDIKEILEIKGKQEIITANSIDELIEKFSEKTKGAILFTEYQKNLEILILFLHYIINQLMMNVTLSNMEV